MWTGLPRRGTRRTLGASHCQAIASAMPHRIPVVQGMSDCGTINASDRAIR